MKPGQETFNIFLKVIDTQDLLFLKGDYLNREDYLVFFKTERIKAIPKLLDKIEFRKSLHNLFNILTSLKDKSISFYILITEKFELNYGVLELETNKVYIFGKFILTDGILNNINNKCFTPIRLDLSKLDIKQLKILHDVRKDFKTIFDTESEPRILDTRRIAVSLEKNLFSEADLDKDRMNYTLRSFADKKPWSKKVETYVTIDDKVNLFIKAKEKNITLYEYTGFITFDKFINEDNSTENITDDINTMKQNILDYINSNDKNSSIILKQIYDNIDTLDLTTEELEQTKQSTESALNLIELEIGKDAIIDIHENLPK